MIAIKTEEQINGIRTSCHLLTKAFEEMGKAVKIGTTTAKLNQLAEEFIADHGAKPSFKQAGFPTALCASVNEVVIHGVPNSRPLKEGDVVGLDLGLILNGYYSDMAKTFAVGSVSKAVQDLLINTEKSLFIGIEAVKNGGRIKDIGKAISGYLKPLGYGVVFEYGGHGVGLEVHEEPFICHNYPSEGLNPRIQNGMVLAIEPMVTLGSDKVKVDKKDKWSVYSADRSMTAHFEHTIAIFNDKVEILTLQSAV